MLEVDVVEVQFDLKDFDISMVCLGGVGGQNVNKVEIVVDFFYKFIGICVFCIQECFQLQNWERVLEILCVKLLEWEQVVVVECESSD